MNLIKTDRVGCLLFLLLTSVALQSLKLGHLTHGRFLKLI
jgi:hypothetical protein